MAYWDLRGFEHVFRDMAPAEARADGFFDGVHKGRGEFVAWAQLEE